MQLDGTPQTPEGAGLLPGERILGMPSDLASYVRTHRINEIVIALDGRSIPLPEQDLIHCRLEGVSVTDSASFVERITGR
ncbi:MAG: hypothetical protein HC871_12000 [Rhizobiales bacterium]|nr:hypothetical protein [Hyphomicrobiales bacterium]